MLVIDDFFVRTQYTLLSIMDSVLLYADGVGKEEISRRQPTCFIDSGYGNSLLTLDSELL